MIKRLPFHTMSGKELLNKLYAGDKFFCNRFVFKRRGEIYNCYLTTVNHDNGVWHRVDAGSSQIFIDSSIKDLSKIKRIISDWYDCNDVYYYC